MERSNSLAENIVIPYFLELGKLNFHFICVAFHSVTARLG